jgi:hypothetical protein
LSSSSNSTGAQLKKFWCDASKAADPKDEDESRYHNLEPIPLRDILLGHSPDATDIIIADEIIYTFNHSQY